MTIVEEQVMGPIELALMNNRLDGIIRAMMNTLQRTARSVILAAARDCSCAILTAEGELLAVADSIPIHVFKGADLIAKSMLEMHPDLKPGDAFLHNSPYHGNSHTADWAVLVPVFDAEGIHRFTVLAKGHLADTGNSIPATMHSLARDVYEEGALVFPATQVQRDYEDIEDIINICKMRIRIPELWYGDYQAMVGAARIGERQLQEVMADVGFEELEKYTAAWLAYSERRMRAAIRRLPRGRQTLTGRYDPVPGFEDGIPINVSVEIDSDEELVTVDLRDNIDCAPNGLNLSEATASTACLIGIFVSLDERVPSNAGSFSRIRILLRDNCIVGIPSHPTSTSMATTHLAERVAKQVAMAVAELGEGFGMAEVGATLPVSYAKISGIDNRRGARRYADGLVLGTTHGAGTPTEDGWLTLTGIGACGVMKRDSIEIDEYKFPLMVYEERLIQDSEGAGKYRGAPGAHVEFGPIGDATMEVVAVCDGVVFPARGARGGGTGAPAGHRVVRTDGTVDGDSGWAFRAVLNDGDRVVSDCAGGGGYGNPVERSLQRVARDVREGWVSVERAREVYKVAVDVKGFVDVAETARLRGSSVEADR